LFAFQGIGKDDLTTIIVAEYIDAEEIQYAGKGLEVIVMVGPFKFS
jgi:hypothetical protein